MSTFFVLKQTKGTYPENAKPDHILASPSSVGRLISCTWMVLDSVHSPENSQLEVDKSPTKYHPQTNNP